MDHDGAIEIHVEKANAWSETCKSTYSLCIMCAC